MVAPIPRIRETLTGRVRARAGWFGVVVLQVEVRRETLDFSDVVLCAWHEWRDARVSDMLSEIFAKQFSDTTRLLGGQVPPRRNPGPMVYANGGVRNPDPPAGMRRPDHPPAPPKARQ